MAVRKKTEEQQELELKQQEAKMTEEGFFDRTIEDEHFWYNKEQKARYTNSIEKLKKLDKAMIDKALALLEAGGDGSDQYKIQQIEKGIEIYQIVKYM